MTVMEIALLVVGVIIFVISFLLPDKGGSSSRNPAADREEVRRIVEQEIDGMKLRVNEATNDTVEYAVGKAERSLERVSNEKIIAVSEYAGTVMEEINKNHNEVMFLYDMLRDKQTDLTNIVREADAKVKEIENVSHNAQNASETLLRGMTVATVSQKGLTAEQKSVFDNISIPTPPVVSRGIVNSEQVVQNIPVQSKTVENVQVQNTTVHSDSNKNDTSIQSAAVKPRGIALAQSKIMSGMLGDIKDERSSENTNVSEVNNTESVVREKVAYDILSGSAFSEGNIVNVAVPAGKMATAADFAALASGMIVDEPPVEVNQGGNNNDKILELSRSGLGIVDIARTLNLGVGEVKLVLELFR